MVTEPTNAVIVERLERLSKDFYEYRKSNNAEIEKIENKVEKTSEIAVNTSLTMSYVKTAVDKMEAMMTNFVKVQNEQNKTINDFVNSDSRRTSKNNLVVSILQVIGGIMIAVIGFWAKGQM